MEHYKFNQNLKCEFFPCHKNVNEKEYNCIFCFCPLYALGEDCGGSFVYTEKGIKDCTNCSFPHKKASYPLIIQKLNEVMELVKKKDSSTENP